MLENIELDAKANGLRMPPLKPATSYYSCSLHEAVKLRGSQESFEKCKVQTIPQFFRECCEKYKDVPALAYEAIEGKWTYVTYGEYEKRVEQAALLLLHLGVEPRSSVAILAFNCPEWFYFELGALRIGAVVTGIYSSNSAEAVYHVLERSEATVCLVDDAHQMSKVREVKSRLNKLHSVIQLNGPFDDFVGKEKGYYRWTDLYEMQFNPALCEELFMRERDIGANECALLIFTSGTIGMPKGVMISHDGILFCCHGIVKLLPSLQKKQQSTVSYLPLNHIAAQTFDIFMSIENGGLIYFADRNALKGSLSKTFDKSRATILFGVPRVFEKLQEKLVQFDSNSSGLTKILMNASRSLMERYHMDKMERKPTSSFKYWLASRIVLKIKAAMGMDNIQECFIGGAPVTEELKKFCLGLDMPLKDVFGMSETSGAVTYNFERPNLKTVGKPFEGVELQIANPNEKGEGEILIRGRCNFMGYLKEVGKTLETLTEDGWIKTGDLGHIDKQGNLYVNGRIKELIITAGGENIPPVHIENIIKKELPCISNAMVVGDHRKYLTILLTIKTDFDNNSGYPLDTIRSDAKAWLETIDVHYTNLSELLNIRLPANLQNFDPNTVEIKCDAKVLAALEEGIRRYNKQAISHAQRVQYFTVLPHDFSIPTGELGPTLKFRRNYVHKKYAKLIDKMYTK